MNVNTIKALIAGPIQNAIAPLALGASTTETVFSVNGNVLAGIATKPAIVSVPTGYLGIMGNAFKVFARGTCTTGTSANLTLTLYQVPSTIVVAGTAGTVGNDASLKASTARAVNSTTAPFFVEAVFQWDSVGKAIKGEATFEINNLLDVYAASTAVTGVAEADLNFALSATLSSGNVANVVNLIEFGIDQL